MNLQELANILKRFTTYIVGYKLRKQPKLDVILIENILFRAVNDSVDFENEDIKIKFWKYVLKGEDSNEFNNNNKK